MDEIVPARRPWERMDGESEKAFAAFRQYLELPKVLIRKEDGKPRRRLDDLAKQTGKSLATLSRWARPKAWNWEWRAAQKDEWDACHIDTKAEQEEAAACADKWRSISTRWLEIAAENVERLHEAKAFGPREALDLGKAAVLLRKEADRLSKPGADDRRAHLTNAIKSIARQLAAAGMGGSARGGAAGNLEAVERTVRVSVGDSGQPEIREIRELSGEVYPGDSESDVVGEAD